MEVMKKKTGNTAKENLELDVPLDVRNTLEIIVVCQLLNEDKLMPTGTHLSFANTLSN